MGRTLRKKHIDAELGLGTGPEAKVGPGAPKSFKTILKALDPKVDFKQNLFLESIRSWYEDFRNGFCAIDSCVDVITRSTDPLQRREWIGRLRVAVRDFELFGTYVDKQLALHFPAAGPDRISIAAAEIMAYPHSQTLESASLQVRALHRAEGRMDLEALLALELETHAIAYPEAPDAERILTKRMPRILQVMELMDQT